MLPVLYSVTWIGLLGSFGPTKTVRKIMGIMGAASIILTIASLGLLWVTIESGGLVLPSGASNYVIFASIVVAGNGLIGSLLALVLRAITAAMKGQRLSYSDSAE